MTEEDPVDAAREPTKLLKEGEERLQAAMSGEVEDPVAEAVAAYEKLEEAMGHELVREHAEVSAIAFQKMGVACLLIAQGVEEARAVEAGRGAVKAFRAALEAQEAVGREDLLAAILSNAANAHKLLSQLEHQARNLDQAIEAFEALEQLEVVKGDVQWRDEVKEELAALRDIRSSLPEDAGGPASS